MKLTKILSSILTAALIASAVPVVRPVVCLAQTGEISINSTTFPDNNLRMVVTGYDTDNSGGLSADEINAVTYLRLSNMIITSTTGIQYFTNLTELRLYENCLSSIDLSALTKLRTFYCMCNDLTEISFSGLTELTSIDLYDNQLTTLDVSNLTNLSYLNCSSNQLTSLNAANCPKLIDLRCSNNNLRQGRDYFYVGNSIDLNNVDISHNNFTSMDWGTRRTKMKTLNCSYNDLASLSVNGLTALEKLDCYNNELTALDVSNLSNLKELDCSNNHIDTIDVSSNTALLIFYCSHNNLTELDVHDMSLTELGCDYNNLTLLNAQDCTDLQYLNCGSNNLSSFNLIRDYNLKYVFCGNNRFSGNLIFRRRDNLLELDCSSNPGLTSVDVSVNPNLKYLKCSGCDLETLDVSHNPNLIMLNCYNNHLTSLDLTNNNILEGLNCHGNDLTELDLTNNQKLTDLFSSSPISHGYNINTYGSTPNYFSMGKLSNASDFIRSYNMRGGISFTNELSCDIIDIITPSPIQEYNDFRQNLDQILHGNTGTPAPTPSNSGSGSGSNPGNNGSSSGSNSGTSNNSNISNTPFTPSDNEPGVAGFVERLYTIALGRASDPDGKFDWIAAITLRGSTGADAARGFLYSDEFMNKGYTNEDFVTILYRTFFNRNPEQAGFEAWVNALNNGASKEEVIEGFINSTEWANLCLTYGIRSGGTGTPNIEVEPTQGTIDFCTRLYTTCLNREADSNGLMAWARQLANERDTGSGAAYGFFFSSEFIGQNVDNSEYVRRLYRTFMGREPDSAGFNAWVAQLDSGVSRETVFRGFAESPEFTEICAIYGIIR